MKATIYSMPGRIETSRTHIYFAPSQRNREASVVRAVSASGTLGAFLTPHGEAVAAIEINAMDACCRLLVALRRGARMFFSTGSLSLSPAFFQTHVAVDRGLRVFAAERRGVTFRTHLIPGAAAKRRDVVVLWFIVSGWASWTGAVTGRAEAQTLVALSESAFDGARGLRDYELQSSGAPFRGLEVRVPSAAVPVDVSWGPRAVACSAAVWDAVERYLATVFSPGGAKVPYAVVKLLEHLVAEGLLARTVVERIVLEEDPRMTRIWDATAEAYARFDTRPTLKRIADACGMSLRNLSRFVDLAYNDLMLPSAGWRDMSTNLRLMIAILFLSCPDVSVADVAGAVGYGHAQAMANAFKRAGVPTPREVQAFAAP